MPLWGVGGGGRCNVPPRNAEKSTDPIAQNVYDSKRRLT